MSYGFFEETLEISGLILRKERNYGPGKQPSVYRAGKAIWFGIFEVLLLFLLIRIFRKPMPDDPPMGHDLLDLLPCGCAFEV